MHDATLVLHLLGLVLVAGGVTSQLALARAALREPPEGRLPIGRASVATSRLLALPGILISVVTGIALIALDTSVLRQGWLHAKLLFVLVLLVTLHVELFLSKRALAQAAAAGGPAPAPGGLAIVRPLNLGALVAVMGLAAVKPF